MELPMTKSILDKIEKSNCLNEKELRVVEAALIMNEFYEKVLNEMLGLEDNEIGIRHKII